MTNNRALLLIALGSILVLGLVSSGCDARGSSNEAAASVSTEYLNALARGDQAKLDTLGMAPVNIRVRRQQSFGGQSVSNLKISGFRIRKWSSGGFGLHTFLAQAQLSATVDGKPVVRDVFVAGSKFPDGRMQVSDVVEQARE